MSLEEMFDEDGYLKSHYLRKQNPFDFKCPKSCPDCEKEHELLGRGMK